jgi:hypothetical protein
MGGNLIRRSLKTDLLTVAKLRLGDLEKMSADMWKPANLRANAA